MRKIRLAAVAALIAYASFANPSETSVVDRNTGGILPPSKTVAALTLATYKSKCGVVWDFVIPYTNLRQVPGFLIQMMDDADKACGTDICYYEY